MYNCCKFGELACVFFFCVLVAGGGVRNLSIQVCHSSSGRAVYTGPLHADFLSAACPALVPDVRHKYRGRAHNAGLRIAQIQYIDSEVDESGTESVNLFNIRFREEHLVEQPV